MSKVLNFGANSFASPNWAGGTALVLDDDAVINQPFGLVSAGLDNTGIAHVDTFKIKPGATQGQIGGSAGSLLLNVSEVFSNYGRGITAYISGTIGNLDNGPGGTTYLTGGTATNAVITGGVFNVAGAAVVTNFAAVAGSGTIENNATAITSCVITGGNWTIKRVCTLLIVGGNATVTYEPPADGTFIGTSLITYGGRLNWLAGAVPTVENKGGIVDFTDARVPFTPGVTSWKAIGTTIRPSATVSLANLSNLYLSEAPMPVSL